MVQPIDIAIEVHKICEEVNIPLGLSPTHGVELHAATTALYAEAINSSGLDHVTGKEAVEAIIEASGWDREGQWPGHPSTDKVIGILNG